MKLSFHPDSSSNALSLGRTGKFLAWLAITCTQTLLSHAALPVIGWGDNSNNQIGIPDSVSNAVAIAAGGGHNLALKADGTVAAWGYNPYGQLDIPAGLATIVDIAAGYDHSLALRSDGTIVGWGRNDYGQAAPPASLNNVVAISANQHCTLALKSDGTVVAWGNNDYGQSAVPPSLANVVAISAGAFHALALKNDGTVVAWGRNDSGQTNVPPGLSHVVAIAAGGQHSLVLKDDGTVFGWGDNSYGQATSPVGLSNVLAISSGFAHNLAARANGTVMAWGWNTYGQATVPAGLSEVGAVSAGFQHSLALVTENHAPVITCPPHITLECGSCNTDPSATGTATATDPDHDPVGISYSDVVDGDCPKIVTRTWVATDPRGKTASCVQTISCLESSFVTLVTDSSGCAFDRDPSTPVQDFRLIFSQDPQNMPCYRLNGSNPGQYFYNVFSHGAPGQQASFNLTLPYPFVTQGANPIHAYDGVTVSGPTSQQCLVPGNPFFVSAERVTLASYGNQPQPGVTIPVTLTVPPSGNVFLTVHLDYGLKGFSGFTKNAIGDAVDCATGSRLLIQNHDDYVFMTTGAQSGIANISNQNTFKKNPGVGGMVRTQTSAMPVPGTKVKLTTATGALILATATDEDGYYMLAYKHTGKAATFYVTVETPSGYKQRQAVVLAANKFVNLDFWTP